MITSSIESHERRDLDTIDITGAYLHMDSHEELITILKWIMVEFLVNVEPNHHKKYILVEKGVKVLYVR